MPALNPPRPVPPPTQQVTRQACRAGSTSFGQRFLAEEVPVAFSYDGTTHAVLMATPADLEDFAFGFSFTEGIIGWPADIAELGVVSTVEGIVLRMWLTGQRSDAFAARRRRFVGPAGCGMCGLESLAEANRAIPMVTQDLRVSRQEIDEAVAALPQGQALNMQTRSVHAAAFWERGCGLVLREDVGRHNALDKLAGALLRNGRCATDGIVVLSSRISIELVQKTAMMGAPIVVGISAPTGLAVRTAEAAGITLAAIARDDGFEVFSHPERITNLRTMAAECPPHALHIGVQKVGSTGNGFLAGDFNGDHGPPAAASSVRVYGLARHARDAAAGALSGMSESTVAGPGPSGSRLEIASMSPVSTKRLDSPGVLPDPARSATRRVG